MNGPGSTVESGGEHMRIEYRRGTPIKDQYIMICSVVKKHPGITKASVHGMTGIPLRTLHRRTKELEIRGVLAVQHGCLTLYEDLPEKRIYAQVENPVFELRKRLSADVIEKGIQWLSVKAFFGLENRSITLQDNGKVQQITVGTNGSALSVDDCRKLWKLLKDAFRVPFVCVDYEIVVHGYNMGGVLDAPNYLENVIHLIIQKMKCL